ncbi:MAG: XRE family transcriptional regulator [Syntrophales bacterium]|nr:XRE family transcriptional regulator [Syntrophales bacterium]MDD5643309.1 XRE family transcriptional regulator [Syntrophales bacterium]
MLARRLEELRLRWGLTKKEMAQRLGISIPYLSEILTGKKTGMRKIVDFAERLDVSIEWLTGEQILIPLVAEVTAGGPFQLQENDYLEFFDITHLPGITKQTAMHCYALRVRGDSLIPFHKDGDILIVKKNSKENLRHGDMVVCHQDEGCYLKSLDLTNNTPKLRPLDLTRYQESEHAPILAKLDKIVFVVSS